MARRTAVAEKPAPAPVAKAAPEVKGTAWLVEHVNEVCGTDYTGYQLRILIRKLVKDETLERGEGRYEFKGPRDPQVLAIVKAVKAGGVKDAQEKRVKEAVAEKPAAPARRGRKPAADVDPAPARRTTRSRRTAKPVVEDDDDELDLDEI